MSEITLTVEAFEIPMYAMELCELTHNGTSYVGEIDQILTPGYRLTSGHISETQVIFYTAERGFRFPLAEIESLKVIEE